MNALRLLQTTASVQPPVIKGRGLALRKLTKAQRALLVRDIVTGAVTLADLSIRQLAAAVGVSTAYAHTATRLSDSEYEKVRRGLRSLVQPKLPAPPLTPRERFEQVVAEIGHDEALTWLAATEKAKAAA
jgi:hypothetical protein